MSSNESTDIIYTVSFQADRIEFWILLSLQLLSLPCFPTICQYTYERKTISKSLFYFPFHSLAWFISFRRSLYLFLSVFTYKY
jgi:hypothetical protein